MDLLTKLIEGYLDNSFEDLYYFDIRTGEVILETDPALTGEPGIGWDDSDTDERYVELPKISSSEAFEIMERFANEVTNLAAKEKLLATLENRKPFRHFKDTLDEFGLRDEWFAYERDAVAKVIHKWLEEWSIDLDKFEKE